MSRASRRGGSLVKGNAPQPPVIVPATEGSLEAAGVVLVKRGRTILKGVEATFPQGKVTAVVGPSGAGKSSLLRCLNRLDEPGAGRIRLNGVDIRSLDPPELRRRVGMIFQTPLLFDGGVRRNLTYGLERVDDVVLESALDDAGLPASFLERSSTALSVGQAQRVCIARALVRQPEALLFDEPTSALDVDAAARIESLISALGHGGLVAVIVTHDLALARRVCDRAVLLVEGRVRAHGDMDTIEQEWGGPRWN
jgi:putative ABC transport system ATP-binding protein